MNDESNIETVRLQNLMRDAKHGDTEAFETLYKEYYTPLFRYIKSRIKNKEDAEDITQSVFMKIWNGLPNWNEKHTSPLAFFFYVARNIIIDTFRKKSYQEIISDEVVVSHIEKSEDYIHDTHIDTEKDLIRQYLQKLSQEQQEILSLIYTNDLSYKEISEITNKKEEAIRQTHSRAIKKLRTLYEKSNE